jgi:formylglycine-generating enzyme required for sulfatase activity
LAPRSRGRNPILRSFTFETLTLDSEARVIDRRHASAQHLVQPLGKGVILHLVQIPGGMFTMGAPDDEPGSKIRSGRSIRSSWHRSISASIR